jgi:hypothetical protein
MVPGACGAHFDDVAGEGAFAATNACELGFGVDAASVSWQARAKNVVDMGDGVLGTHRALVGGGCGVFGGCAPEFGVSITDIKARKLAALEVVQDGLARQSVVDVSVD